MTYAVMGRFHGVNMMLLSGLDAEQAARWIVRLRARAVDWQKDRYWLEMD